LWKCLVLSYLPTDSWHKWVLPCEGYLIQLLMDLVHLYSCWWMSLIGLYNMQTKSHVWAKVHTLQLCLWLYHVECLLSCSLILKI
jgi:hypothetical protein